MNKNIIIFLILIFNLQILIAQNNNRTTSEIQINVLTESLEKTKQPQELSIEVNKNNLESPKNISISIEDVQSNLTLVSAKLNNQDLWLINSTTAANNEKVVAWNFDEETDQIQLFPFNWNSPYILELNIQVNLKNLSALENQQSTNIILTSELSSGIYEALPTGNGSEIQLR